MNWRALYQTQRKNSLLETWRWFGPNEPITLKQIRQTGAKGVVTALHEVPTGQVWPLEDLLERKCLIENAGLEWTVVESIPVHEDIKTQTGNWQKLLENYKQSVRNVGEAGITTVCYNFMPVLDCTRTQLRYEHRDTSRVLRFDMVEFAAYDVFVLKRPGAEKDFNDDTLRKARERHQSYSPEDLQQIEDSILLGLPGGYGQYDREAFLAAIARYRDIDAAQLKRHLNAFIAAVAPVAEQSGVNLCIHPDDPPFPLFGLPRVVSTADDARELLNATDCTNNGLTLCAGSFGARGDNDLISMVREFGPRIHFVHLRNVQREDDGSFYESEHLSGDNDMVGLVTAILDEEDRRKTEGRNDPIPMRPDHGGLMEDEAENDTLYPGYSYGGRMKGLAELRGVARALESLRARGS